MKDFGSGEDRAAPDGRPDVAKLRARVLMGDWETADLRCPGCDGDAGNNWFDRSLCADPCGVMHTRCRECGVALDDCHWESSRV